MECPCKNYGKVCCSNEREECICFNSSECKCMMDELSVTAQEIMKSNVLKAYVFALKRAYERYLERKNGTSDCFMKGFYAGKADSVLSTLNDLGFGFLVSY